MKFRIEEMHYSYIFVYEYVTHAASASVMSNSLQPHRP